MEENLEVFREKELFKNATNAIEMICKSSLCEIRSFANPPILIHKMLRLVYELVIKLKDNDEYFQSVANLNDGKFKRSLPELIEIFQNYDMNKPVTQHSWKLIKQMISSNEHKMLSSCVKI